MRNFDSGFKLLVERVKPPPQFAQSIGATADRKAPCAVGLRFAPRVFHPTEVPRFVEDGLVFQIVVFLPQPKVALRLGDDLVELRLRRTSELTGYAGVREADISCDEADWAGVAAFHASP